MHKELYCEMLSIIILQTWDIYNDWRESKHYEEKMLSSRQKSQVALIMSYVYIQLLSEHGWADSSPQVLQ